jgi:hypothetical protein
LGESAFRDGEDDGIGAFHWLDEGFGHAWRHVDRALLFRAGGDRQPADRAGWRQSQASAGTREGQLTDHLVASLARSRKIYWARCAPEPIDFAGICATTTLFHCAPEPAAAALPGIKL